MEGYEEDMPIAIAGIIAEPPYSSDDEYKDYTIGDVVSGPIMHHYYAGNVMGWMKFLHIYQGRT